MEKEFLVFLKSKNFAERTIKMYLRVLKKDIPKKLREKEKFIDIFECNKMDF